MMKANKLLLLIMIVGALVFTGCSGDTQLVPIVQEVTIDTTQFSEIHISTEFTKLNIIPSKNDEIQLKLHGQINAKYRDQVSLQVTKENQRVFIQVQEPKNYRNLTTDVHQLDIVLPQRNFDLIKITGATADFRIDGISANQFEINAAQGNIQLAHLNGNKLDIRSTIGQIMLEHINGDMIITTEQGKVTFLGDLGEGNRSVVTKISDIDFTLAKFPDAWEAYLATNQGVIEGALAGLTRAQQSREWQGKKGTGGVKVEVMSKQGNILFP